jgi:hypothetical protein
MPYLMIWKQIHCLMIKMLYNRCTGIYKFGNNTYPQRIRRRSNLGHIFGKKSVSYGPGNMVKIQHATEVVRSLVVILSLMLRVCITLFNGYFFYYNLRIHKKKHHLLNHSIFN